MIALREVGVSEKRIYMDKQSGKDFNRPQYKLPQPFTSELHRGTSRFPPFHPSRIPTLSLSFSVTMYNPDPIFLTDPA